MREVTVRFGTELNNDPLLANERNTTEVDDDPGQNAFRPPSADTGAHCECPERLANSSVLSPGGGAGTRLGEVVEAVDARGQSITTGRNNRSSERFGIPWEAELMGLSLEPVGYLQRPSAVSHRHFHLALEHIDLIVHEFIRVTGALISRGSSDDLAAASSLHLARASASARLSRIWSQLLPICWAFRDDLESLVRMSQPALVQRRFTEQLMK
jgi:hypothetical protein